ncbi:sigma-54-dependent Fis family transcriptional regulator [Tissierella sp. P1]|uniref:sigma-54-dependent transcriptional regulator n=1 Tax=Tissierella sp. P1 TaxID=1280483 RepID=UPI000BA0F449|nr:sigma-54 dependent transcriptional regulator [Tissierella sp. P1]MDU5081411.1 sigma-54 dependent transcriptional regulator [Bacillota bacterium]OZV12098.1 sigma-54-dependent Fis family transcriptional regulator [Tissierella sp. P1]
MKEVFKILIVDDEKEHRETYRMLLESRGFIIGEAKSGDEALNIMESEYYPIVLCDVIMPGLSGIEVLKKIKSDYESVEVIMVTGYGGVETAVEAMKIGAFGYFIKSHNPEELLIEIEKAKKLLNLQKKNNMISTKKNKERYLYQSKNPKMKELLNTLEDIGQSSANVLLLGESGVGKEIIAQRLHDISKRSNMPFIAINCQYYSTNLLESELFGHEKGSFTGANEKRIGRFEEANGGTIFLDEIGEISQEIQVKFLRVLENRKIERMGSNKQIEVDFRLICATNKNLLHEIQSGNFREDLFYRINTIILEIPPLRERKEDILDMINFFIDNYKMEFKKDITKIENETLKYLLNYSYPGNIRELKNIIERMFVLCKDGILKMEEIESSTARNFDSHKHFDTLDFNLARANFEKEYLINALKLNDNNITKTAEVIGLSRRQLFNKINEYNLREFMS